MEKISVLNRIIKVNEKMSKVLNYYFINLFYGNILLSRYSQ